MGRRKKWDPAELDLLKPAANAATTRVQHATRRRPAALAFLDTPRASDEVAALELSRISAILNAAAEAHPEVPRNVRVWRTGSGHWTAWRARRGGYDEIGYYPTELEARLEALRVWGES